ncbi:unnamed protein product [Paramecium pentaurelia]|uniref:Uncharacterized protein n=1 Tax=Paramecium pentaurelia TaxID=43138 RepID=A0A8S1U939_9CILI|nr:unnamed protein product [Paramecium pentaurelia]
MGTCGGKKTNDTKTMKKMREQDINNTGNDVKANNEQNIITKRNEQDGDILKQQQQEQVKTEIQYKPVEDQASQTIQDKSQKQTDYHKLSEIMPKPEIFTTTPIIQLSKKKFQDDDPAKHHLECIKNQNDRGLSNINIGLPVKFENKFKVEIEAKGVFRRKNQNIRREDFVVKVADEDVHSKRLASALNIDDNQSEISYPTSQSNFFFRESNLQKLDLSDLYRIDFDNSDKISIVPTLIEPLENIVKNPGIYPISEFKNHHNYNYLKQIQRDAQMNKFDVYIPPSKDVTLQQFAKALNLRYCVSTSTFSNVLSQIFYLLSGFHGPDFSGVFEQFPDEPRKFMISQRKPTSALLHRVDENMYALDGDPGIFEEELIELLMTGKIVERQLTQDKEEFENRYIKLDPNMPLVDDFHRFMELNNEMCLRSQIDCRNRSDNPIVFEIKARGACPIRYDYPNYRDYLDYEVNQYKGLFQSFEREYYDLIRGAFLKWAIQLKIGRMDGAFVAYHNLLEIQGFEYIKSSEIYKRVFGTEEFSDLSLLVGSRIATKMFDEIIADINEDFETLKIGLYSQSFTKKLILFVEIIKDKTEFQKVFKQENLKDEYDYYTKHPLKNKVLKYEFLLKPEINGIEYCYPTIFRKNDLISIKYKLRSLGQADFGDYMNFLHDCYKHEEINIEINYSGAWQKSM